MPTIAIFDNDAFSVSSLTKAINETQYVPRRISELGLFTEEGITTTTVMVEKMGETLSLVPAGHRGAPAQATHADRRQMLTFATVHLPQRSAILADAFQNVRAFGSETELETVQTIVNQRLLKHRRRLDATLEFQRMGAIKGLIVDADGTTVIADLMAQFGVTQQSKSLALSNADTKVRQKVIEAKRQGESALGDMMATGWRCFASPGFMDSFTNHAAVLKAYDRWQDGAALRADPRAAFLYGDVLFEEYRGQVGDVHFIADGEAYLIPEGVPDLFVTNYAPADYMETVNTIGLPYYSKQEPLEMSKGVMLESQSNPLSICTRPRTIIKLTA